MSALHGPTLLSARSLGLRMFGAALMALCLYHLVTHTVTVASHDVVTVLLFGFGAYLTFPDAVEGFVKLLGRARGGKGE